MNIVINVVFAMVLKLKYIYVLLLPIIICIGCYKEDFSDCPIYLHVSLESVMKKYTYKEIVDQLDLYLYDENERFVSRFSYDLKELESVDYSPVLPIEQFGMYTITALVNSRNSYTVSGSESLSTLKVSLDTQRGDTVKQKQDDLYYASKELIIVDDNKSNIKHQYETLDLYKNTNHLNVDISFKSDRPENYSLFARLEGNNGSFDYTNKCNRQSFRIYQPHEQNDTPERQLFHFTTMQIWLESDLVLIIETEEQGKRVVKKQIAIMEEISKIYDTEEKLNQEDEYDITLVLKPDFTIYEFMVNDWYIVKSGEEI